MRYLKLCSIIFLWAVALPLLAQEQEDAPKVETPAQLDKNLSRLLQDQLTGYASREELLPESERRREGYFNVRNQSDSVIIANLERLPSVIPMQFNPLIKESIAAFLSDRAPLVRSMLVLGDVYFPIIESILDKNKMPVELMYLPIVESALNPLAVSPAGAAGLWQFMLPTAKRYGLEVDNYVDERLDIARSTEAAARYLKDMYGIYHDWLLCLAAYNCGPGNVNKAIRRAGGTGDFWDIYPYLPRETRNYIPLFIGAYYAMYYHAEYNIDRRERYIPLATDTLHLSAPVSFSAISDITGLSKTQIRNLNPQYKKEIIPGGMRSNVLKLPLHELALVDNALDSLYKTNAPKVEIKSPVVAQKTGKAGKAHKTTYKTYTVRKGDTLSRIASRHGISLSKLKKANGIRSNNKLKVGTKLRIPSR